MIIVESKFSMLQPNGKPQCTGDITLREMIDRRLYVMMSPDMGDYRHKQAIVIKEGESLTVTFIGFEDGDAADEQKWNRTITFQINLLRLLQENCDKLMVIRHDPDSEFLLGFLKNLDIAEFSLSILIETIAYQLSMAARRGALRVFDTRFGTNYRSMVSIQPSDEFEADRVYDELCRYAAERIAEEGVTLTWALRQYECEKLIECSVLEILAGAVKTFSDLERDVLALMPAKTHPESGFDFIEISLQAAMTLFSAGDAVHVDWDNLRRVEKGHWAELNTNHLQHGKWYMRVTKEAE
ncbi:hypothetical protein [Cohnella soli]|uniref:Uncharacterized protein n=1 Tax=Cohnella soli TaxID=425005 RepID=A0ABW0HP33_9BACL